MIGRRSTTILTQSQGGPKDKAAPLADWLICAAHVCVARQDYVSTLVARLSKL
jgi:hypothetical protein